VSAITHQPTLIIQVPRGAPVERALRERPPTSLAREDVVIEAGPTDAHGDLEPPDAGEVVLSVPSPETLSHQAEEVHRVIAQAGEGIEPLVVVVEAAEDIPDDDLGTVLDAARHAPRPVILRVIRNA
jgi:hypothetical protein